MVYKYIKSITSGPFGTAIYHNSYNDTDEIVLTELATLEDGYTYVALKPNEVLPTQPSELTFTEVILDEALKEQLKKVSPVLSRINQGIVDRIRERYTLDDELYFTRIAVGALRGTYTLEPGESTLISDYQLWVEESRDIARLKREEIGFS